MTTSHYDLTFWSAQRQPQALTDLLTVLEFIYDIHRRFLSLAILEAIGEPKLHFFESRMPQNTIYYYLFNERTSFVQRNLLIL